MINSTLPFIQEFIESLNDGLKAHNPNYELSNLQSKWLCFCLMGILWTNSICWAKFERAGFGSYSLSALSWMFRKSEIAWDFLLMASIMIILRKYGITEGSLIIDESDRDRSKNTTRIFKTYKQKDKKTGGYVNGQTVVLLLLVTSTVTLPVGFVFYIPDPVKKEWEKRDNVLKKQGVKKKDRPAQPATNPAYPTKPELALKLLRNFRDNFSNVKIKVVLADALYGIGSFMDKASELFGGIQVLSQLRNNQNVQFFNKKMKVSDYFGKYAGVQQEICIRGGDTITATVNSVRIYVDAHGKKRFVVALKYHGESEYRYIVATDLSWSTLDIIKAYSLRWLIEVFFEDWKSYEGWGQLAKQPDDDGSSRGLLLSLLLDHCLILHPLQQIQVNNKLPAYTVGSLQRKAHTDIIFNFINELLNSENLKEKLEQFVQMADTVFTFRLSKKHMSGRDLGRLEPTPSLKHRALTKLNAA